MKTIKLFKIGEENDKKLYQSCYSYFENTFDFVIDKDNKVFKKVYNRTDYQLVEYSQPVEVVAEREEIKKEAESVLFLNTEAFLKDMKVESATVLLKKPDKGYVRGSKMDSFTNVKFFADKYILTPELAVIYANKGLLVSDIYV